MYRIDEFLDYYNSLSYCQTSYKDKDGKTFWVNAKPLPFYYGILTIGYWKEMFKRLKDCKYVIQGRAEVVTWENIKIKD